MANLAAEPSTYTLLSESSEDFVLDSEIEARILESTKTKKVAFLSGTHRTYYPEKPGFSKFAKVYSPKFGDPKLPPRKLYMPPDTVRLNKPISKKGYGIGGLSAPRFRTKSHDANEPGPANYQIQEKAVRWQRQFPPQIWMKYGLKKKEEDSKHPENREMNERFTAMLDQCQQVRIAFGSSMKLPRFGKDRKWNCVGPGHYTVQEYNPLKISVNNGFLRGPIKFNSSTILHCSYGPKDCCVECGQMLMSSSDYYRSKRRVSLIPTRSGDKTKGYRPSEFQIGHVGPKKRILLCRECYCKALHGESKYWAKKKDVEFVFEKTRHCSHIHEHNGLPEYTTKASCYWTRKLAKKEAALSLHWPDKCPKRVVEARWK